MEQSRGIQTWCLVYYMKRSKAAAGETKIDKNDSNVSRWKKSPVSFC